MTPHPIAITGMHRSGTSMITRGLHDSGLHLLGEGADEFIATADDNPEGFWENKAIVACNDDLLEAAGGAWDNPPAMPPQALDDVRVAHVVEPASAALAGLRVHDHWGFKDPRLCLTAAFWLDLEPELRFIICVRHPLEVALSLKRRNQTSYSLGLALWERYYATILELVPPERRIVSHYDTLFDDPDGELARLCAFAGLTPASLFVRTDLRHHTVGVGLGEAAVSQSLLELYRALSREAGVVLPREAPVDEGRVRRLILDAGVAQRHADQRQAAIDRLQEREQEHLARIRQLEREITSAKLETGTRAKALHAETMRTVRELAESSSRTAARIVEIDDRTRATAARVDTVVKLSQPSMARRALRRVVRRPLRATLTHVVRPGRHLVAGRRKAGSGRATSVAPGRSPARPTARGGTPSGRRLLSGAPSQLARRAPVVVVRVVRRGARTMEPRARLAAHRLPPPAQDALRRAVRGGRPALSRTTRAVGRRLPPPAQRVVQRGRRSMRLVVLGDGAGAGVPASSPRKPAPKGPPAKQWLDQYEGLVAAHVPDGAPWLVVTPGSPRTVNRVRRPAGTPFPRTSGEDVNDLSHVAQLEARRYGAHRHLVVPEGSRPWLHDHHELAAHLLAEHRVLADEAGAGIVFDLTAPPDGSGRLLGSEVAERVAARGHGVAVLDWTQRGIGSELPGVTTFRPAPGERLPYADASVEVVVIDETRDRSEAVRVASSSVITVIGGEEGTVSTVAEVEELSPSESLPDPRCLVWSAAAPGDVRWQELLAQRVSEAGAELLLTSLDHAGLADLDQQDVVVLVEPYVLPLPGSLRTAASLAMADQTAAVAAKVVAADGRLWSAGGTVFSDRSVGLIAAGCSDVRAPWHDYVRPTCWAPGLVAAAAPVWAGVERPQHVEGRALVQEWCSAVWTSGRRVVYQPGVVAVRVAGEVECGAEPLSGSTWQRVLDLRPHRPSELTDGAWRYLLAHDDVEACRA